MRKPVKIAVLAGVGAVLVAGASGAAAVAATDDQPSTRAATATADTRTSTSAQPVTRSGDRATAGVDRADAEAAARKAVPGGRVTETDRDRENGRLVWEVDLTKNGDEYEVDVDAHTGTVVKVDHDRHDDGGRHDDHDDHDDHGHDDD